MCVQRSGKRHHTDSDRLAGSGNKLTQQGVSDRSILDKIQAFLPTSLHVRECVCVCACVCVCVGRTHVDHIALLPSLNRGFSIVVVTIVFIVNQPRV